jgi:hypothetical protein
MVLSGKGELGFFAAARQAPQPADRQEADPRRPQIAVQQLEEQLLAQRADRLTRRHAFGIRFVRANSRGTGHAWPSRCRALQPAQYQEPSTFAARFSRAARFAARCAALFTS